jgi:hypothetical protein
MADEGFVYVGLWIPLGPVSERLLIDFPDYLPEKDRHKRKAVARALGRALPYLLGAEWATSASKALSRSGRIPPTGPARLA